MIQLINIGLLEPLPAIMRQSTSASLVTYTLVFGLFEEPRHDIFHEGVRQMYPEGLAVVDPGNNILAALARRSIQHVVKLPRELEGVGIQLPGVLFVQRLLLWVLGSRRSALLLCGSEFICCFGGCYMSVRRSGPLQSCCCCGSPSSQIGIHPELLLQLEVRRL